MTVGSESQQQVDAESGTDSDMDSVIRNSHYDRKGRNQVHRVSKEWNN